MNGVYFCFAEKCLEAGIAHLDGVLEASGLKRVGLRVVPREDYAAS